MSILDNLLSVFNKKSVDKIVGIDIGSSSIKLVQLSKKNDIPVLDTFGELSMSLYLKQEVGKAVDPTTEELIGGLKDLMKESQVDTFDAAFAIPLKSTLMFNLKLPKSIDKIRLHETVLMESRKYIPVPLSEVQMDWSILPNSHAEESDFYDILVISIHKDTLNKYINIAKALNLNVKFLEVEVFSTIRSVIHYEKDTTIIVDMGSSMTKVYIVENSIIRKTHIVNIGSSKILKQLKNTNNINASKDSDITNETAHLLREEIRAGKNIPVNLVRITDEIKKTIFEYQREHHSNIDNMIFTGGGILFEQVKDYMAKELAVKVEVADPFSKVDNPAYLDEALRKTGPEFAVSIGLCLRGLSE